MILLNFPKVPKTPNTVTLSLIYVNYNGQQSGITKSFLIHSPWENPDKEIEKLHQQMEKIIEDNCV